LRVFHVTVVQTGALPIFAPMRVGFAPLLLRAPRGIRVLDRSFGHRSAPLEGESAAEQARRPPVSRRPVRRDRLRTPPRRSALQSPPAAPAARAFRSPASL